MLSEIGGFDQPIWTMGSNIVKLKFSQKTFLFSNTMGEAVVFSWKGGQWICENALSLGNSKVENGNEKFNDSKTKSDDIVNVVEGTCCSSCYCGCSNSRKLAVGHV
ncbi:hypothetical protein CK203_105291 [Vitis vinifera]|uniref:Uncharacterized protein n=1 Tax=Vitis vinifera TaxID=29760 RepID=A0A438CIE4_VITVI|nr:hypothetical protein CK203_105291 [Vitis vinifera]